jgi:hypothetical protein
VLLACAAAGTAGEPDRSTPKAAFESFADRMEALQEELKGDLDAVFMASQADTYGPVLTDAMAQYYRAQEKERLTMRSDKEEGRLTLEKEEAVEADVLIWASQKNKKTVKERDRASGEWTTREEEEVKSHKLLFTQVGETWRLKSWHEKCTVCGGKGACPDCDGTGTTKPKECYACKGEGKSGKDVKCFSCDGTGKRKPEDCFRCRKTQGKCSRCGGNGWKREDSFESGGFFLKGEKKIEAFLDLSTPENAAKSFLNRKDLQEVKTLTVVSRLAGALEGVTETFFVPETLEKLRAALAKSAERYEKKEAGKKVEVGETKVEGETAVVTLATTSVDRKGKSRTSREFLKLVKAGADWKVDDRGSECWSCKGAGVCTSCDGTGQSKPRDCWGCKGTGKNKDGGDCFACKGSGKAKVTECYNCKKDKGKCGGCMGQGYSWERAMAETRAKMGK